MRYLYLLLLLLTMLVYVRIQSGVCPIRLLQQNVASLLLLAQRAGDIGRQRQVPNSKCKQCHVEIRDTRIKGLVTEAKTVVTNNIITK